jgi:hypothetical protein
LLPRRSERLGLATGLFPPAAAAAVPAFDIGLCTAAAAAAAAAALLRARGLLGVAGLFVRDVALDSAAAAGLGLAGGSGPGESLSRLGVFGLRGEEAEDRRRFEDDGRRWEGGREEGGLWGWR